MSNLTIDPEFRDLLPALSPEAKAELTESIKAHGCRDPICVWGDVIIDGHNRYGICQELGKGWKTKQLEFPSREDAMLWMVKNQLARRNLTPNELSAFRGKQFNIKKQARGGTREGSGRKAGRTACVTAEDSKESKCQNDTLKNEAGKSSEDTATELAESHGVSRQTINRDGDYDAALERIKEHRGRETHRLLLENKAGITKGKLIELHKAHKSHDEFVRAFEDAVEAKEKADQHKAALARIRRALGNEAWEQAKKLDADAVVKVCGLAKDDDALAKHVNDLIEEAAQTPAKPPKPIIAKFAIHDPTKKEKVSDGEVEIPDELREAWEGKKNILPLRKQIEELNKAIVEYARSPAGKFFAHNVTFDSRGKQDWHPRLYTLWTSLGSSQPYAPCPLKAAGKCKEHGGLAYCECPHACGWMNKSTFHHCNTKDQEKACG